jgi:hypothetical protein
MLGSHGRGGADCRLIAELAAPTHTPTLTTRDHMAMQELRRFFKANPQVLVLLIICLVLGLGTFLAVLFGVATSKNPTTPSGEPSGRVPARTVLVADARWPPA